MKKHCIKQKMCLTLDIAFSFLSTKTDLHTHDHIRCVIHQCLFSWTFKTSQIVFQNFQIFKCNLKICRSCKYIALQATTIDSHNELYRTFELEKSLKCSFLFIKTEFFHKRWSRFLSCLFGHFTSSCIWLFGFSALKATLEKMQFEKYVHLQ